MLGQVSRIGIVGGLIGAALALGLGRLSQAMLFGVEATAPAIIGGAVVLALVVAFAAAVVPARRAALMQPVEVLKPNSLPSPCSSPNEARPTCEQPSAIKRQRQSRSFDKRSVAFSRRGTGFDRQASAMSNFRYAFHALTKQPGPTLVVVLTLAVAIAASTVLYSAIDLVQHFLPVVNRDGLVYAASTDMRAGPPGSGRGSVVFRSPVVDSRSCRLGVAKPNVRATGRLYDGILQSHGHRHPDARRRRFA